VDRSSFILPRPLLDSAAARRSAAERIPSDCIGQHPPFPRWTSFPIFIVPPYVDFSNKQVVSENLADEPGGDG
jgi:hypothetical protein